MADNLYKETFSHVKSSYEFNLEDFEKTEKEKTKKHFPLRKLVFTAAAAAVAAALAITASATGFFRLTEPTQPEHQVPDIQESADVAFVNAYAATPEAKAAEEYAQGEGTRQEAADKYGLTLPEREEVITYAELTELQGGELFLGGHTPAAASINEAGSFRLEGTFTASDGRRVAYELLRVVKGTYVDNSPLAVLQGRQVRPFDAGDRTLALVESGREKMLVADLGESWAALVPRGADPDAQLLRELGESVDWQRLAVAAAPALPEKGASVTFGAGVEIPQESIIQEQSFRVNLSGLGRVRFISCAPTESFTDVRFFFSSDGHTALSELEPVLTGLTFEKVAAVSFEDLTGDSFADILLLIDYRDGDGGLYRHVRIFKALDNGNFTLDARISKNIEAAVDNRDLSVPTVRAYLRTASAQETAGEAEGFARVLSENLRTYGDRFYTRYALFDLTGDGEPELLAGTGTCEADAQFEIWTAGDDGQAQLLGTLSSGHSLFYDCDGVLTQVYGQMGWEIVSRFGWDGAEITEEVLSERLLSQYEDYAEPGTPLLLAPADDISLIEPMSYEEVVKRGYEEAVKRAGSLDGGPDSFVDYTLYDMNGDGGEELILRLQEPNDLTYYRFYTLSQGRAVFLGEIYASHDTMLAANGTNLYLLERDLEGGAEQISTVVYTEALTQSRLSYRTGLSPADFTDPVRLGRVLELAPAPGA